jgi:hypothetical protein
MTPQDHNKVIGIMHLIWGGFNFLMMLFIVPFILMLLGPMGSDPTPPAEFKAVFGVFMGVIIAVSVLFTIPPLLAGYALLKRKSWAKVAGIVSACFTAFSMPFGTALTVYTIWFLCGQQGDQLYRKGAANTYEPWRGSLRDANAFDWEAQRAADARRREQNYAPPPQPPDWRS